MDAHDYSSLDEDLQKLAEIAFPKTPSVLLPRYRYKGTTVSESILQILDEILNMEVREDDTWICSYMKSGTHWTSEMIWMISNNLDFEQAKVSQLVRVPNLEIEHTFRGIKINEIQTDEKMIDVRHFTHSIDLVKTAKSPRYIKTHMPFHMLPLQIQQGIVRPKIVYVMRNPMDVCVSYFNMFQHWFQLHGSLEDFAELFMRSALRLSPFWHHRLSFLNKKETHGILCLKFEDMIEDLPSAIQQTADFLDKKLTDDQVALLSSHLSFSSMKNNKSVSLEVEMAMFLKMRSKEIDSNWELCRKGVVGDGKSRFSPEMVERFKKWTEDNTKGTVLDKPIECYGFSD